MFFMGLASLHLSEYFYKMKKAIRIADYECAGVVYPIPICTNYHKKNSSALYIGMAKVLPIIDVLGYDGQNSSSSSPPPPPPSRSDSTPITQKGSHIST